jgi:hypothetical protein
VLQTPEHISITDAVTNPVAFVLMTPFVQGKISYAQEARLCALGKLHEALQWWEPYMLHRARSSSACRMRELY